jgi:uncharacterized RDD family membrane protein YckC
LDPFNLKEFPQNILPEESVPSIEYAGILRRFFALFIDNFLTGIIGTLIGAFTGFIWGFSNYQNILATGYSPAIPGMPTELSTGMMDIQFGVGMIVLIISWLYFACFESSNLQGTPGKRLMGIMVTDMDGERLSFGSATGRYLGKIISGLILGIGFIVALFTPKKQALHDLIAGTVVIIRKKPPEKYD